MVSRLSLSVPRKIAVFIHQIGPELVGCSGVQKMLGLVISRRYVMTRLISLFVFSICFTSLNVGG